MRYTGREMDFLSPSDLPSMRKLAAEAYEMPISAINMTRMATRILWERTIGIRRAGQLVGMFVTSERDLINTAGSIEQFYAISWLAIAPDYRNGRVVRELTSAFTRLQQSARHATTGTIAAKEGTYAALGFMPSTERLVIDARRLCILPTTEGRIRIDILGPSTLERLRFESPILRPGNLRIDAHDFEEYLDVAYKYLGGEILCAETAGDKYGDFEQSFAIIQQRKLNAGRSYMHVLFTRCGSASSYRELWEGITASWPGTRFILVNSPLDEPLFDFLEPASRATRTIHPGLDLYFAQPRRAAERIGSDVFDGIVNGACTSDLLKTTEGKGSLRRLSTQYLRMRGQPDMEVTRRNINSDQLSQTAGWHIAPHCQWQF